MSDSCVKPTAVAVREFELSDTFLILNEQRHGLELLHVDQSLVGQFE
jgi:hypothetical protein